MKLKELEIVGGTVYVNIVDKNETVTETMAAGDAVKKYGELEVKEHTPYTPDAEVTGEAVSEAGQKGKKKSPKPGTDIVILKG